ncbi:Bug family tripartite tricarboxylate transporter substrate binding protein [Variovorax sp.]|jgi:tripartite-type tricarboxylate transporter receptor subunit TctC|uniref:Bug family tripartite tricarboxylate transporter substrate binding protein n=1 Tax=Variovorax sp. TaxID=1871043 RepID=UPI00122B3A69|nr:tripartite tricarboxylate transporter substrate binding protein [Variovorax sp.]TAJ62214.1 MAG: tripartite tricarboxylate transporter substrate binding protein [Variovorax sp.]
MTRHLPTRRLLLIAAALLGSAGLHGRAQAQNDYPDKPIKLVVGYSAGGPTDILARVFAQDIGTALGQSVIVENKPGANGNIATEYVQRAAPDGYTLVVNTISHNVNPLLQPERVKYDPVKDFTPVSMVAVLPQLIVVAGDSPYRTLGDLVKKAQSGPSAVSYGTAGVGGSAHLAAALLEQRTKTKMNHIPFKGNAPALTEVMAGRVDFMFFPMVGVSDFVASGRIRILATTTAQRHPDYPQVPTTAELGFKGFEDYAQPIGFIAPAGLPAPIAAKLDTAIAAALAKPAMQAKLKSLGAEVKHLGPAAYRQWLGEDRARWAQLIQSAGIKGE